MKQAKCVTLDEDIVIKVETMAKRDDRTFSAMLNAILRRYFKKDKF